MDDEVKKAPQGNKYRVRKKGLAISSQRWFNLTNFKI